MIAPAFAPEFFPLGSPYRAWLRLLYTARAAGDLDVCLELRREDAEAHAIPIELALNEERAWHAAHAR
jgi:hypothetical protein